MIDPSWISGLGVILFGIGLLGAFTRKKCDYRLDVH
jgi:NADH:ubiquinone oxidoreductase subunit K